MPLHEPVVAHRAGPGHQVGAVLEPGQQQRQLGRVVLAVGVHHHHDVGVLGERALEAAAQRGRLAHVAAERDEPRRSGCALGEVGHHLAGLVGRAVVDDEHVALALEHGELRADLRYDDDEVLGLVEGRDHDPGVLDHRISSAGPGRDHSDGVRTRRPSGAPDGRVKVTQASVVPGGRSTRTSPSRTWTCAGSSSTEATRSARRVGVECSVQRPHESRHGERQAGRPAAASSAPAVSRITQPSGA